MLPTKSNVKPVYDDDDDLTMFISTFLKAVI